MKVIVAIQLGIYRHHIIGIYTTLDTALNESVKAIENEIDHYHNIEIIKIELDKLRDYPKDNKYISSEGIENKLAELTWDHKHKQVRKKI